ncbi:hypothetical protein M2281_005187 [Mesorhizobium soli]|nr:hypothetical protein [Mesorhizobium soli]
MMDDRFKSLGSPTIASQDAVIELFAEDAPTAQDGITPESTSHDSQIYATTTRGKVRWPAHILALNSSALKSAVRANPRGQTWSQLDLHPHPNELD